MDFLTEDEREILTKTAELYNLIVALPVIHPDDNEETATDLHNIQNRIMARAVQRHMKDNEVFNWLEKSMTNPN